VPWVRREDQLSAGTAIGNRPKKPTVEFKLSLLLIKNSYSSSPGAVTTAAFTNSCWTCLTFDFPRLQGYVMDSLPAFLLLV
jgi:hypothetical protein